MIFNQVYTREYSELLQKIRIISSVGSFEFGNPPISRVWKFYRSFCTLLYTTYIFFNWTAIYTTRVHPISMLLQIGIAGGTLASLSCGCDFFFNSKEFHQVFISIGKFEKKHANSRHFREAFQKSRTAMIAIALFNSGRFFLVVFFSLMIQLLQKPVWTEGGKFNIKLPLKFYLPFVGPPTDWVTFGINYVYQFLGAFLSLFNYGYFMITVSVLALFSVASLNVLIDFIEEATRKMEVEPKLRYNCRKCHEKEIKEILAMHVSIVE